MLRSILILASFLAVTPLSFAQQQVLRIYGPGGPLEPMKECAAIFARDNGIRAEVVAGPESKWIEQAKKDADVIYGGAEYMLTQFIQRNPGVVDEKTRDSLWVRAAGILVRKGNPKKIRSISDLARQDVRIIDVAGAGQLGMWEDLAGELIPVIQRNIVISVPTSAEAIDIWKYDTTIDAWITYESWQLRLNDVADLVRLAPGRTVLRGTPIAVATTSDQGELARSFIRFLHTETAHAIFRKWGWR